jgi:hypothetical protein
MINLGKYFLPVFFSLLGLTTLVKGQKNEIGGGLGILNYRGEISRQVNPVFSRPAAIVFVRRNFSPVVSVRLGLTFGALYADEFKSTSAMATARRASMHGMLTEGSAMLEYNFFDYVLSYLERRNVRKFSPYLTGGIALFYASTSSNLPGLQTETNAKVAIPMGVGVKFMLNGQWNFGTELIARKTFTDKLDGLGNTFINNKLMGDPDDNDYYYYLGVSLSYTFYKVHCPKKY